MIFQEYRHAVDLGIEVAKELRNGASTEACAVLERVHEFLIGTNLENMHPFGIACFSEHPDKLSQWRAYGLGEGGIAIGFNRHALVQQATKEGTTLGPVIYDLKTKTKMVKESFEWMLSEYRKCAIQHPPEKRSEHLSAWLLNWAYRAAYVAPMFKDDGFQEEDEWRLMRRFIRPSEVRFNAKKTHLCPYMEIHPGVPRSHPTYWPEDDSRRAKPMPQKLPITDLWFGPGRYQEQAWASCKQFLEFYDYDGVNLHKSKTPFRSMV